MPSPLNDRHYEHFRDLILARTGVVFDPRRRDALTRGVLAAAGRAGCEDPEEYYRLLRGAGTQQQLWDDLIGTITVGETYFFRNSAHIDALRHQILPDLIARHRDDRRLRVWSAGCSTGEEPYSVAILLRHLLPDIADWNVHVLGTDINRQALWRAREGSYREWSLRQTDRAVRESCFTRRGDSFQLSPPVREMVTFSYLNLVRDEYPSLATSTNAMDLILCRNVAIYLPEKVVGEVVDRFHGCLVPGGWLIMGASETSIAVYGRFAMSSLPGAILYRKTAEPSGLSCPVEPRDEPVELLAEDVRCVGWLERVRTAQSGGGAESPPPCPEPMETEPAVPVDLYREGVALLGQGCYEEAKTRFLAYLEEIPDSAPACCQMARVQANIGRLEEARRWAQKAIDRDRFLVEAYYVLALVHQEEGALDDAIAEFKRTLYLDPKFVLAHVSLCTLYRQIDRRDRAARHRAQAIRLAAKMAPGHVVPGSDGLTAARLLTVVRATV